MSIVFYNTLTKRRDEFVPLEAGKVGIYTCGPTVYNYAHIGNLRTFLFEDLLRRHLEYRGYAVTHVMNLTDVEDKIIRTCRETGESLESLTGRYAQAFLEDLDTLRILRPHVMPRATETIPDIVDFIKTLRERGHTYEVDGSIYFRLASFGNYGKLSGFDIDALKANADGRIDSDEYETEDARDFALWKAWDEDDGDVYWDTELGKGRPGWHIECSCMSRKHLGDTFDIHCGGSTWCFRTTKTRSRSPRPRPANRSSRTGFTRAICRWKGARWRNRTATPTPCATCSTRATTPRPFAGPCRPPITASPATSRSTGWKPRPSPYAASRISGCGCTAPTATAAIWLPKPPRASRRLVRPWTTTSTSPRRWRPCSSSSAKPTN